MAQKRMFSLKIIDSAKFLKMPLSSQLLYFHLGMRADDDGVVEGYNVLRMTGINEDDLRVLSAKGFIKVLNEDLVAYISDWREHNSLRPDRKINSLYQDLLLQVVPDAELLEKKKRKDSKKSGQSMDGQVLSISGEVVGIEQNRLEQIRLEQYRLEQQQIIEILDCSEGEANVIINAVLNYHNGKDIVVVVSEKLKIINAGSFKNRIGALVQSIKQDWQVSENKQTIKSTTSNFNNFEPGLYDYDDIERKLLGWDDDDEKN